jgi:hypothetical protein
LAVVVVVVGGLVVGVVIGVVVVGGLVGVVVVALTTESCLVALWGSSPRFVVSVAELLDVSPAPRFAIEGVAGVVADSPVRASAGIDAYFEPRPSSVATAGKNAGIGGAASGVVALAVTAPTSARISSGVGNGAAGARKIPVDGCPGAAGVAVRGSSGR